MSSYYLNIKKDYCYIIESFYCRDKDINKLEKIQKIVGKADKRTGKVTFYPEFINTCNLEYITIRKQKIFINDPNIYIDFFHEPYRQSILDGLNINNDITIDKDIVDDILLEPINDIICPIDIKNSKHYGGSFFLNQIAEKINLVNILKDIFPKKWQFLLNIVFFTILENKNLSHCKHFSNEYFIYHNQTMSSQRISDFLNHITQKEKILFYQKWIDLLKYDESIALDIISADIDNDKLDKVDFLNINEHNDIEKVNLCILFDKNSYLPMYQVFYQGILTDINTFKNIIDRFYTIIGDYNFTLVLNQAFYSQDNINYMLSKETLQFIISVPLTANYVNELILLANNNINKASNYIETSKKGDNIKGLEYKIVLFNDSFKIINSDEMDNYNPKHILKAFVLFNIEKQVRDSNKLCKKLADAKREIFNNHDMLAKHKDLANKFFIISYNDNKKIVDIAINEANVEKHTFYCGYSVLLSNSSLNIADIYKSFLEKEIIENSYRHFKDYLSIDHLYISENKRLNNKNFIIQLCQILYCHIHKIMLENDLFDQYSIPIMLDHLNELKSFTIKDKEYIQPITALQSSIYNVFSIPLPKITKDNKISF
jgi:transposase